jgi:hypothetical protein
LKTLILKAIIFLVLLKSEVGRIKYEWGFGFWQAFPFALESQLAYEPTSRQPDPGLAASQRAKQRHLDLTVYPALA